MSLKSVLRVVVVNLLAVPLAGALQAAPLRVTPPTGARFLVDQRFDIRVEADPALLSSVKLFVDGRRVPPGQLQADPYGKGLNLRNRSFDRPGRHVLRATDGGGNEAVSSIEVVDPFRGEGLDAAELAGARDLRGERPVRNIIILLGDGMGASHRTAARLVRFGVGGGRARGLLAMDTMPGLGLVMTASLNSIVTDSAPGMSNYVTGNKANNNQEGVFPDNTLKAVSDTDSSKSFDNPRVEYLSEYLHRKRGKSLGIVTTADIEDATPAANAVHTADRNAGTGICDQYLDESFRTGLSVLMGGGRRWFVPADDGPPTTSCRATCTSPTASPRARSTRPAT
jgi:alkaline phosphatase